MIQLARAAIRLDLMPKEKDQPFEIDKAFNCNGHAVAARAPSSALSRALVGPDNVGAGGPDVYGDKEKLAKLVEQEVSVRF